MPARRRWTSRRTAGLFAVASLVTAGVVGGIVLSGVPQDDQQAAGGVPLIQLPVPTVAPTPIPLGVPSTGPVTVDPDDLSPDPSNPFPPQNPTVPGTGGGTLNPPGDGGGIRCVFPGQGTPRQGNPGPGFCPPGQIPVNGGTPNATSGGAVAGSGLVIQGGTLDVATLRDLEGLAGSGTDPLVGDADAPADEESGAGAGGITADGATRR